jgi:hypothetical protein
MTHSIPTPGFKGRKTGLNSKLNRLKIILWLTIIASLAGFAQTTMAQQWKRPINIGGVHLAGTIYSVHFVDANTKRY